MLQCFQSSLRLVNQFEEKDQVDTEQPDNEANMEKDPPSSQPAEADGKNTAPPPDQPSTTGSGADIVKMHAAQVRLSQIREEADDAPNRPVSPPHTNSEK